jgi:CysZ protein
VTELDPGAEGALAAPALGAARPPRSRVRRAAAGAWHVIAGFAFLLRRPRLWPLAALPAVVAVVCVVGGATLGWYSFQWVSDRFLPSGGRGGIGTQLLTLAVSFGALAAGALTGLAVALLLAAPVLELLSRRVEAYVRVDVMEPAGGWKWELVQSFKGALYFLAAAPGVLLLSLIPVVGPPLGLLWGAHALALQQTDVPLARRGMAFNERRAWHRKWRPESLGFGLLGLLLIVPTCFGFLLAPALAVGGTLLVLELEEDLVVPDRPAPPPAAPADPPPAPTT